jgi:glycosyltransferase involved in cell wall biosynthesis
MKVLHIIDTLWLGGAQAVVKTFFEKEKGNKNIFLYALRKTDPMITIDHENIIVHPSSSKFSLAPLSALRKCITENKIEVLHCHLPRSQVFGYLLKRFYFPKIKLVFHEQGIIYDHHIVLPFLFNAFKRRVNAFIACSGKNRDDLLLRVKNIEKKTFLLPNFVDTDILKSVNAINEKAVRAKLGIETDVFVVGFAGRIVKRKGWRELIEAANILKSDEKIRFMISGIGPEQEMMLELIEKYALNKKIIYLGYVSNMPEFYAITDCLVLPSYWEGMSLSQQEALASGVPVLITENLRDDTQHSFLTFKSMDADDLAKKIIVLRARLQQGPIPFDPELLKTLKNNEQLFMSGLEQAYKL